MDCKVFDTIIIGAGLGGIRSAQELLKNNLKICMITSKDFCSGASFYPGTWGLGMVGPKNEEDKKDLLENIIKVGCKLSNPKLSSILVDKVNDEINLLDKQGINLKKSVDEDGVIPCFDSNKRRWFGFDFKTGKDAFYKILDNENLTLLNKSKVINIFNEGETSKGVLIEKEDKSIELVKSKSIIIAPGGYTCLFKHNFSLELDSPIIQYLANKVGCELINLEFIQFIPAYMKPMYKTVFNERVFKYITIKDKNGEDILKDVNDIENLISERSTYGPFSTRLRSNIIDKILFKYYQDNNECAYFEYPDNIEGINDTLIYNYFNWMKESKKDIDKKIYITPFAHACNGGIKINEDASTTVNGIFACGEATGGVHGADRIGGLSTCNALVFGAIAGKSASKYCKNSTFKDFDLSINYDLKKESKDYSRFKNAIDEIRKILYNKVSILRSKESILDAKNEIRKIKENTFNIELSTGDKAMLESYIEFSFILLDHMLKQGKSIGCHCRVDSQTK